MQTQEGGRYLIQPFDTYTWSIIDPESSRVYVLALNELGNLIVHVSLTEVAANTPSARYLMYLREVLSSRIEVSGLNAARDLFAYTLNRLQDVDIDNPIEVAVLLGADLHGQYAEGHNQRAH